MARVYVTRQLPGPALARLAESHTVEVWPGRTPPGAGRIVEAAADAEALIVTLEDRVDAELIVRLTQLRVIATFAVGHDNIDLAAAAAQGIRVANTPDVLTEATADLTWALMLAAARRIVPAAGNAAADWQAWEPAGFLGAEVAGATLGIVGAGRIGRAVARRAAGFGMPILYAGRDSTKLEHLLERADFISLHCPLTPQTRRLINTETLALVKPGAILINTARGPIVDQAALAAALVEGRLAGAALDVTDPEPLAPDDPLWQAPNLLITPHIGSATTAARSRMAELTVQNVLAGLAGTPLPHEVSLR